MVARMNEVWPRLKGDLLLSESAVELVEKHQARVPIFGPRTRR
jgi:hypothetical protein